MGDPGNHYIETLYSQSGGLTSTVQIFSQSGGAHQYSTDIQPIRGAHQYNTDIQPIRAQKARLSCQSGCSKHKYFTNRGSNIHQSEQGTARNPANQGAVSRAI